MEVSSQTIFIEHQLHGISLGKLAYRERKSQREIKRISKCGAHVMLRAKHPPLVADLLDNGSRAVPLITVSSQQRVEIEAGEYQIRASGNSRLSQTIGVTLEPGSETGVAMESIAWGQ